MENRIWKTIPGFENYQVSNYGEVRNSEYHIMAQKAYGPGQYYYVHLYSNGKQKQCIVHRLVAEAFLDNVDNLPEINHKDKNPHNNHVSNLEWCTHSHNMKHSWEYRDEKAKDACRRNIAKGRELRKRKVVLTNTGQVYDSVREAREETGAKSISRCCTGKCKSSGKMPDGTPMVWEYAK